MSSFLRTQIRSISREEFARAFKKARPPIGWPETIAVGNSGGPDSLSLVFLLNRYLKENAGQPDIPRRLVSVHVNHDIQSSSKEMADKCAESTKKLGVEHFTASIAWGTDGVSARPKLNTSTLEYSARIGRYRTFYKSMFNIKASVIALAHHLDDQVETSIMRLSKGSTEDGAAGMRFCRRWGMDFAGQQEQGYTLYEGMKRWVVRPLLQFPKDRLLATCEENNIEYVVDKTNTMAHITARNAIRRWLHDKGPQSEEDPYKWRLDQFEKTLSRNQAQNMPYDLSAGKEQLYGTVTTLTDQANDIESQVDSFLARSSLRSPAGTHLVTTEALSSIRNDWRLRRAIVLRILRYVSFHPWGSLRAQVKRRNLSLVQIVEKIWNPDPLSPLIREFCAGGGVQWCPVIVQGDTFRFVHSQELANRIPPSTYQSGWLALRQSPPRPDLQRDGEQPELNVFFDRVQSRLYNDITPRMRSHIASGRSEMEVLYDCRFLLTFDLTAIPAKIRQMVLENREDDGIWIVPWSRFYWPNVVWKRRGKKDVVILSEPALKTPAGLSTTS